MNNKLIKQLQNGEIAVKNDGTFEELEKVLNVAFPDDDTPLDDFYKSKDCFLASEDFEWNYDDLRVCKLKSISVKEFFKPNELTLEELIEAVKLKAKIEGYNCDVVLEERREENEKVKLQINLDVFFNANDLGFYITELLNKK